MAAVVRTCPDGRMSPKDAGREWSSSDFDGTTVLCRVCGDKASGFHYGVHSCEGCKGFFRRSIQQKIQYRPCTKNQQCSILRVNRNRCQYCRLKKCIAVGMSRDAVRFGRVPKREKAKILAAMQSVNARSQEKALAVELEDESKLVLTIVTAHIETCDYTKDKMGPVIQAALEHPVYTQCTPQLACPLNPHPLQNGNQMVLEDFSHRFSPAIRGVVEFAKRIPGFGLLSQDDQVTLLKAGVFEVLLVRLACMFDSRANRMICLNGQVLKRESLLHTSNARFLMDSMFDFADRMNTLQLADGEVGLFCAVVVIASDRPGLRNVELVEKMQDKLMQALQALVSQGHPESSGFFQELMKKIPDLRTLNTLHSEKLLAFKMEPHVEAPHQTEVTASTNMHALYQTHVGHWGTYGMQHQSSNGAPSEDSKGSWEEQDPLVASHLIRGGCQVEAMAWSPAGNDGKDQDLYCSPRSSDTGSFVIDDGSSVKSPLSSVSSVKGVDNESLCSGEMVHLPESRKRRKDMQHHEGGSSGDESSAVDGLNGKCPYKIRKLESPTDSGIESGKELGSSGSSGSRSTSICSSPRSSMEDKVKDISDCEAIEKMESIEDMPVLKRALQAPPLINTNLLMDEAYKPHKKFRALRKDSDSTPTSPDVVVPTSVLPQCPQSLNASLASSHSMLVKSLEQGPRMSEQQLKHTDIIRNIIMRSEGGQSGRNVVELNSMAGHPPTSQHQYGISTNGMVYSLPQVSQQQNTSSYGAAPVSNGKSCISVCPPGYYIPQPNGNIGTAYPASPASSSWSTFVSAAQPTTVVAPASPSSCAPAQARSSYVPVSSGMQQMTATVSILPASPTLHPQYQAQQQQMQQATSPGLAASPLPRMYYNPRGSASASPTLAATPQSPISVVVSQVPKRASPKPTSPMTGQILEHLGCRTNGDSQPLNLSKKMSPSPPPMHHLASLQTMERTVSAATLSHMQRVKLEAS